MKMNFNKSLLSLLLGGILYLGCGEAKANLMKNGEFRNNADDWKLIDHDAANWQAERGWNGKRGYFFINHDGSHIRDNAPETNQLIKGLKIDSVYEVSGYFKRQTQNHDGINFRVLINDRVVYAASRRVEDGWVKFEVDYTADEKKVLLRFQSQVSGDDAYFIDNISFIPKQTTIPVTSGLLGFSLAGGLALKRRFS